MTTLLITHPVCLEHLVPRGHPERPDRLRAINQILAAPHFEDLERLEAPRGLRRSVLLAHDEAYVAQIEQAVPAEDLWAIDADTWMSPKTLEAALRGVGAATRAVDAVFHGEAANVFCAMRPPGHHAEQDKAMGFCFFNNAAIAALHAREAHNAERVAVIDFDVHHGNGTQDIFWSDRDLFYASTHQMPLFPGTGEISETGVGNIVNAPLRAGDGSAQFREAMMSIILPALDAFEPDLIVISAGFDAHRDDPLGSLQLTEEDFIWITLRLVELADRHCAGRVVSLLEGGYDLRALATSVGCHVQALMRASDS
ncbi:histone deacetylase family protein [Rhodoligotrophos ferricapiens]|uniref:histone deacetylase family protein n=1 Tax=Rhodoligotrophos ferricapiens TaxID=3069264 RepID=UPI00315D529D